LRGGLYGHSNFLAFFVGFVLIVAGVFLFCFFGFGIFLGIFSLRGCPPRLFGMFTLVVVLFLDDIRTRLETDHFQLGQIFGGIYAPSDTQVTIQATKLAVRSTSNTNEKDLCSRIEICSECNIM
jgi:hypothetical protein